MPRRVALHRRVKETFDPRKSDDLVELAPDLRPRHAEDGAVEEDVLAARELGVEASADFEEARHPAMDRRRGLRSAR